MKKTEINYPTQEWLDNWVDKYIDKNPNEKITDFKALEEKATEEWWDNEIDHNRPTPFDLTPEQQKVAKEATKTGTRKTPTNYKFDKKKRPKDAEKVEFLEKVCDFCSEIAENCEIVNAGQEISFKIGENEYSLKLVKHRKATKQWLFTPKRGKKFKKVVDKQENICYNKYIS